MLRKVAVSLVLLTAASILILPFIQTLSGTPTRKRMPFVGMTLSYQVYHTGTTLPRLLSRMVTFYGDPSEPDFIWVRDSENQPDDLSDDRVAKIDVETRRIVWADSPSGDVEVGGYSEALFPTDLHVGDEVVAYWGGSVMIIGSQRMSVMGEQVDAWIVYTPTEWDGTFGHYTMYYEKQTGIWLGGNVIWYEGDTLVSWAMHLVSTNAPLFEED